MSGGPENHDAHAAAQIRDTCPCGVATVCNCHLSSAAQKQEYEAMVDVVIAASDQHDEKCGCEGEACKVGDALAKLDAIRGMRV